MDMNTAGKRGFFTITHRTALYKVHQHLLLLRVHVPGTSLPFKALSDQAPHSNSKSLECRWGQCSVVLHTIIHCEVGSQPGS